MSNKIYQEYLESQLVLNSIPSNYRYESYLNYVNKFGQEKDDRTKTGVKSLFGGQMEFDLNEGFPLITTKKVFFKGVAIELLWFLKGDSNIKFLKENNVKIWDEWATESGDLGPVYGVQWTSWKTQSEKTINQIANVIEQLKNNKNSRRIIVSGWNVEYLPDESKSPQENVLNGKQALPPCHTLFQFYVDKNNKLSCKLFQRSADLFLGVPFNIASYALLTHMIAQCCDLDVGKFVLTFGDSHIYSNHYEQVELQLSREPRKFPKLKLNPNIKNIFDFTYDDISIVDYNPHDSIKAEISV
mgnify:CR=1 FL=1